MPTFAQGKKKYNVSANSTYTVLIVIVILGQALLVRLGQALLKSDQDKHCSSRIRTSTVKVRSGQALLKSDQDKHC